MMAVIRVGDGDAVRVTGATEPRRCYSLGMEVQSNLGHGNDFAFTRRVGNKCTVRGIRVEAGNVMGLDLTVGYVQVWTGQNQPVTYNECLTWQPLIPCYYTGGGTGLWLLGGDLKVLEVKPEITLIGDERRFALSYANASVNGGHVTATIDIEEL